jgi:hypothetical protein
LSFPTVICEVAFATDPGATPTWVDISDYVRDFSTNRGRTGELDRFAAGRATILLANADRRFDPSYAAGPYYPDVVPMRRIRVRATYNAITYDLFNGYVDGWEQTYQHPQEALCSLTATDAFKVLANIEIPPSVYAAEVLADSPSHWWRLGDPAGSTSAIAEVGTAHLTVVGTPTFGSAGLTVRDPDTAVSFTTVGSGLVAAAGVFPSGTGPFMIELLTRLPSYAITRVLINSNAYPSNLSISNSAGGATLSATVAGTSVSSTGLDVEDDEPHHVALVRDGSDRLYLYVDGVDITSGTPSSAASIDVDKMTVGNTPTFENTPNHVIDEVVVYDTALSAARILAHANARATAWSDDLSGARVGRILDAAGWPAADRQIDTGVAVLQGADLGGNALAALQKVEETEQGRLFVTTDGKVRFIGRDKLLQAPYTTSQATYGDSGAELEYDDLVYRYDDQTIYNEAHVSRVDGTVAVVRDTTSQTRYLRRVKVIDGLLHASDTTSIDLANWTVAHYKDPLLRVTDLTLHPTAGNETTHFPEVLGTELAERVTVRRRPQNLGAAIDQETHVEGIEHSVTAIDWVTKWNLSPAETESYWIWGVSTWGESTRWGF